MWFKYKEIEKHFVAPLPGVEVVTDALINHAFEVEEMIEKDGDMDMDIKILPDRAADAKSVLGVAREISAVLDLPLKDEYKISTTKELARTQIECSSAIISALVGVTFSNEDIIKFLSRVGVLMEEVEDKLIAYIPAERLDLNIKEDLADEVARLYGYDKVPARPLPAPAENPVDHPDFILSNQLREFFASRGFTEVYGYTFTAAGEVAVAKPLASDKAWLRTNLSDWLTTTLATNIKRALFPKEPINLFELGSVFPTTVAEEKRLGLVSNVDIAKIVAELKSEFEIKNEIEIKKIDGGQIAEIALAGLTVRSVVANLKSFIHQNVKYQPVSVYPRIVRDIALFVPAGTVSGEVGELIKQNGGPLLVEGPVLFDEFTKPGENRTSLAFRMAFQASDRTLEDTEINILMEKISTVVKEKGYEVR